MIIPVGNDVLPNPIDCNASQAVEFSFATAVLAKLLNENTVWIEHLNAMIRRIGNYDTVVRANGYAARPRKTSGLAPPTA